MDFSNFQYTTLQKKKEERKEKKKNLKFLTQRREARGERKVVVRGHSVLLSREDWRTTTPFPLPFAFFAPLRPLRDELGINCAAGA